jgi:diguanylate cyclase (GGDEF)-like protein
MVTTPPPRVTKGRSSSELFAALAGVFVIVFAAMVVWLAQDQFHLRSSMDELQTKTLAQAMEQQRLVRNLEMLRLNGERVLYNPEPEIRQQSRYLVSMLAQHPGMQEHPTTRDLATRVEHFIQSVPNQPKPDDPYIKTWDRLSRELSQLADEVSVEGINLIEHDVQTMQTVVNQTNHKLLMAMMLALLGMMAMLLLISRLFILPLKMIDRALAQVRLGNQNLDLPRTPTTEIQTITQAIEQLQHTMQENEAIRAGLEVMATTDALTGLMNRRHFMAVAQNEMVRAQRYQRSALVGLADLDHFKRVNDDFGHQAGDAVLKAVAQYMQSSLRETDLVCRYGGEEFAFVFLETTAEEATTVAERLRAGLEKLDIALPNGGCLRMTLSLGLVNTTTLDLETALNRADDALYRAKAAGRNRVVLHSR